LGVKPVGLIISLSSLIWTLGKERVLTGPVRPFIDATAFTRIPDTATASLIVSTVMVLIWTLFFTKASVRTMAFTYAEMLLRTCDIL